MPWCGYLLTSGGGFWWLLPLAGLVVMGLMVFFCFRGFGCMGGRRRTSGELSDLQRQVESSKQDVRKLQPRPS